MKKFRSLTLALVALVALASCSLTQPKSWSAGTGKIKIVASTNVWGAVANLIAGDLATVDAIIYDTNQDPHSYELTARDQLKIQNADIVIMNGGGYDDFMQTAIDADQTPAITVDAFMASGDDEARNEHIWYDVDQVGDVAAVIGAVIESIDESKADEVEARVADFREKIAARKAQLDALRANGKKVFLTEPLVAYLVEDAGYQDLTPTEFSQAVEEDRDIPPIVFRQSAELIRSGQVDAIYLNANTETAQINSLISMSTKVPNFEFSELLNQGEGYFQVLDNAISKLESK